MEKRELTCIGCPLGCQLEVSIPDCQSIHEISDLAAITVTGNTCKRGAEYARKEVTDPTRIVTSSVRVTGGEIAMVSVKTKKDIPKEKIFDIMEEIKNTVVAAPISIGDVIIFDCAGTGVSIIATRNVNVKEEMPA